MKKIYHSLLILSCFFSASLMAQCGTPSVIPYYEGFSGITSNNQLPACWAVSNPSTCLTYTSHVASFLASPAGSRYFYTNGIQLTAGIIYSVTVWHKSGVPANSTWTDLSILFGANQSSTGLVPVASTNGSVLSTSFTALSNTFVVANSGTFYIAIKGTSSGVNGFQELLWDDLSVIIPCTASYNTPPLTVVGSATSICSGQNTFTATANGADSYLWSTGETSLTYTDSPQQNTTYTVTGTNTLTGCTSSVSISLIVKPSPTIYLVSNHYSVCSGNPVLMTALGVSSYSWSTGASTSTIIVTPSVTTIYSVVGADANGCSTYSFLPVLVYELPVVTYTTSAATNTVCKGEMLTFTADFVPNVAYNWSASSGEIFAGNVFTLTALSTTTVSLKAQEAQHGCESTEYYSLIVESCMGLKNQFTALQGVKIYPNPGQGDYILQTETAGLKSLLITDLIGKIIFATETYNEQIKIDLKEFSPGIYYTKISSEGRTEVLKLIKE